MDYDPTALPLSYLALIKIISYIRSELKYIVDFKNKEDIDKNLQIRNIKLDWWQTRENYVNQKRNCDSLRQKYNEMVSSSNNLVEQKELKKKVQKENEILKVLENQWQDIMEKIPISLHNSVPIGNSEVDNKVIYQHNEIIFRKHHYEMDIFHQCDVIGSRFVILKDKIAKLERALMCFMMDHLSNHSFREFSIPYLINQEGCRNAGNLIEKDNMFQVDEKFLIPTGEVTLVNCVPSNISLKSLPFKICTASDCFRREAGASGKDTKGLVRLHQFKKCEMVCFTQASHSYQMLEEMLQISCDILKKLGIPYRYIVLCSADTSIKSAKTYDIEIPIGGQWREVASISNCETFQTYRMKTKCKETGELLHSLNGSALAIGRTLASLLEVFYEEKTNTVEVPKCLWKYINFESIEI